MKNELYDKGLVFAVIVLFIGVSILPQTGGIINESPASIILEIKNVEESSIEISVDFPEFDLGIIHTKEGDFAVLELHGEGFAAIESEAKLPKLRRMIEIPQDANPEIMVTSVSWESTSLTELDLPKRILPLQPSVSKNLEAEEAEFTLSDEYYSTNRFTPNNIVSIVETGEIRGHHFALVEISPLLYNPLSGDLKLMTSCEVVVNLLGSNMTKTFEKIERYTSPAFEKLFDVAFVNYGYYNPKMAETSKDSDGYLIIVYDDFYDEILPLANWKDSIGYKTTVTKTSEIPGGSSKNDIKDYIEDAYYNWEIPPSYVLLVGDTEQIPTYDGLTSDTATDLYYATMDGDKFVDILIGRFPASEEKHVTAMVNKSIFYEEGDFSQVFVKNAAFLASRDHRRISEGTHDYVIENYLDPNNYTSDRLYTAKYSATTQDVNISINEGRGLVIYSGHGSNGGWADGPAFGRLNVRSLANNGMYPFVCSYSCVTGQFTAEECFGETWLREPNKAAVAFWGSSSNTMWNEDDILEKKMFSAWWDDNLETIGGMTSMALYFLYQHYGGGKNSNYYLESYNVLGDPSIKIWRDDPITANFTYAQEDTNDMTIIHFTDRSKGCVSSRTWDFGDGNYSNVTNPIHVYQNEGLYTVTLTIYNIAGKSDSIQKETFNVTITNPLSGLYLLGIQLLDIKKTIILGPITVEATPLPFEVSEINIDYVEFFIDNVSRMIVDEAPFEWRWDEQTFGKHTVKVVAYSNGDYVLDSEDVIIFNL